MIVSTCCGAPIKFTDICGSCGEHCDQIYDEYECRECGGPITVGDLQCMDCKKTYKEKDLDDLKVL